MSLLRRLRVSSRLLLLGGVLALCACASPEKTDIAASNANAPLLPMAPRNLSGHWEKNFQLSDDFNNRFNLYVADIQRVYNAQQRGINNSGPMVGVNSDAINGLARFTEELTRMPLLDIAQDANEIRIDREGDFPLRCPYAGRQFVRGSNSFGNDICGWESERLVFQLALGGELTITHQFTLSPDGAMLNVTTRVASSSVAVPLVISNYYRRFTPPEQDYNCQLTLTRSTVCSQLGNSAQ
ncbi:MAG: hypothetical protein LBE21_09970 [Pseudomonadales bacterium]|jgi:hypothetical protein|nr:hypothetical protein [Pseudomonadales bacterium]